MIKIIATEGNTTKWEPVEAGTHLARCVRMVHIGTVMESYGNEPAKPKNKVFLTWEFPTMLGNFQQCLLKVVSMMVSQE
jgi:hypothetical protein